MAARTMKIITLARNLRERREYPKGRTKIEGSLVKIREKMMPTAAMMIAESYRHLYWKLFTS